MRTCDAVSTTRASTTDVPSAERVEYWEHYNAAALVGLRCSAFAASGLRADQANTDLGGMRVAEIEGNEHVIERTHELVRRLPMESAFLSIIVRGNAFFYHGGGYVPLAAGEAVLYDTARPYLFGFGGPMQQVLIDLPSADFRERCLPGAALPGPVRLGTDEQQRTLLGALRTELLDGEALPAERLAERAWSLIAALVQAYGGAPLHSRAHVVLAKAFVDTNLGEESLSQDMVARAVGVSARHLNRSFAAAGETVAEYIMRRRLEVAAAQLRDPRSVAVPIGELAHRCGFVSQSHFTRLFKRRFGVTPGRWRAAQQNGPACAVADGAAGA